MSDANQRCSEEQDLRPHAGAVEHAHALAAERVLRVRHSLAHVMAQAVAELRPGTKLGFGPPIADGYYFDFVLPEPISVADIPRIEERMRAILRADAAFEREELSASAALDRLESMREPYKLAYAREIVARRGLATLSFYRSGAFVDMCDGPHVATAREIPADAFQLKSIAGAYFRGESSSSAQPSKNEQRLGITRCWAKELDFFAFDDDVGKGLPLWLPNGTAVRDELETMMRELEFEFDYQRVATPHVAKAELFFRTGHLPYYEEHMFPPMNVADRGDDDDEHAPGHRRAFDHRGDGASSAPPAADELPAPPQSLRRSQAQLPRAPPPAH